MQFIYLHLAFGKLRFSLNSLVPGLGVQLHVAGVGAAAPTLPSGTARRMPVSRALSRGAAANQNHALAHVHAWANPGVEIKKLSLESGFRNQDLPTCFAQSCWRGPQILHITCIE